MTFLSKLGSILLKVGMIAAGLPINLGGSSGVTTQVIINDLQKLFHLIVLVEAVGQQLSIKGPDKLRAAAPLIAQAILESDFFTGKKIQNQALFTQGTTKVADGLADILNSIHPDAADSTNMVK
jgi:hypothetical protein